MFETDFCSIMPSTIQGILPPASSCGPAGSAHRLGHVLSVDIVLETPVNEGGRRGSTKIKLRQVPRFLINAFDIIMSKGMECEGLFRREGNASRLNQNNYTVYIGEQPPPAHFTVYDVCSMVKRFFRDLKEPLFPSGALRKSLLELARKSEDAEVTWEEFGSVFEPGYEKAKKDIDYTFPPAHKGTLGYLMRQLQRIAHRCKYHQMDAGNLATVLAPTLFRDEKDKERRKERRGSQDDLLTAIRGDTKLQIAAVKLMIERANWIGVHPNCYVTSRRHQRSSSAAPSPKQPFMQTVANVKAPSYPQAKQSSIASGISNVHSLDRKASLKVEDVDNSKKSSSRRSSSAFRGLLHGIGDHFRRRSQSRERDRKSMNERRTSSPAIVGAAAYQQKARIPQTRRRHFVLEFPEKSPHCSTADGTYVEVHANRLCEFANRTSRSRQSSMNALQASQASVTQNKASKVASSNSIIRSTQQTETATSRRDVGKDLTPISNKVLKDNPVSMLGEEHFNPTYREQHERSRRRHTTPVKTSTALRRNQPNTRHSGLQQPKRRATVVNAHEQEKENRLCHRSSSVSTRNSKEDTEETMLMNDTMVDTTAGDILSQKGHESRLRRAKRQQRRDQSLLQESTCETSTSFDAGDRKNPSIECIKLVSTACSPIVFTSIPKSCEVPSQQCRGRAEVGETVVVTSVPVPYPSEDSLGSLGDCLPTDLKVTPPPAEPVMSPPKALPTSPTKASVSRQIVFKSVAPNHSAPTAASSDESDAQVVFRPQALPTATDCLPTLDSMTLDDLIEERRKEKSTVRSKKKCGVKGLQQSKVLSASLVEERNTPAIKTQRSNSLAASAPSSTTSKTGDDSFLVYNELKDAILNANSNDDVVFRAGRQLQFRPSVAFIKEQKQGIVRDRVKLFGKLQNSMCVPLETISGRSSGLSSRSSLGAGSADEEFAKPSAPPVTHSLTMGAQRRNSSSTPTHAQFSSRSPL